MRKQFVFWLIMCCVFIGIAPVVAQDGPTPTLPPGVASFDELAAQFDYDTTVAPDIEEVGMEEHGAVKIYDITFTTTNDTPIEAYLVVPPGEELHPAILWVHWLEQSSPTSNRTEFLDEAITLADAGVESLLVNALWARPARFWKQKASDDLATSIQQVVDLRRGLDVLAASSTVDPEHIALVGHDFGGMYGLVTAAVDRRVAALVVMSATPRFSNWFMLNRTKIPQDYADALALVDPITYLYYLPPTPLFFQFGRVDRFVPPDVAEAFYAAASEPKQAGYYDGFHELDDIARQERDAWLAEQLDFVFSRITLLPNIDYYGDITRAW